MRHWLDSTAIQLAAILLTYLVYSTLSLSAALIVTRQRWIGNPSTRLFLLKGGIVLPLLMAIVSPWLGWSRSPVLKLPVALNESLDVQVQQSRSLDSLRVRAEDSTAVPKRARAGHFSVVEPGLAADPTAAISHRAELEVGKGAWLRQATIFAVVLWLFSTLTGWIRIWFDMRRLRRLVALSRPVRNAPLTEQFRVLKQSVGLSQDTLLLESDGIDSPLVVGIRHPSIILPQNWFFELSGCSQRAILAHELAHVVHRDPMWHLITRMVLRALYFQPLNFLAARRLRRETEYRADRFASLLISSPSDLAWSLIDAAEHLLKVRGSSVAVPPLAASISAMDSGLEQRVSAMLQPRNSRADIILTPFRLNALLFASCAMMIFALPRVQAPHVAPSPDNMENPIMRSVVSKAGLVAGLLLSPINPLPTPAAAHADEKQDADRTSVETPESIPEELQQFRGMLIGQLVDRDIERGTFTVKVDYVARVWENNQARNPRAAVGKTFKVDGVTGKWIDQLLLVRPGETLEFEAQHRGGNSLTFPGEWLKKVPAFKAADHPVPPEGFRGFAGVIRGTIERKETESRELIVRIDSVGETFERNRAKKADEAVGKPIVLAGFWAKMSEPFDKLEVGDRIRAGVLHRVPQSDHFTVSEFANKVSSSEGRDSSVEKSSSPSSASGKDSSEGFPLGMQGFRGILRGQLVSKDVEKGELVFRAERVTRTWKQNRAEDTESCRGRAFVVKGIAGKWLDVLITLKPGDNIEVEAFHNGGQHLDFVSEWLKKVD